MKKIVILANGEAPRSPAAMAEWREAECVVCCDGAAKTALALGRAPDLVAGDGDSLDAAVKLQLGDRFVHVAEQDTNDLAKAFRCAVERWGRGAEVVILGAGGLRDDHLIGNVYRLAQFAGAAEKVSMVTNYGRFIAVRGEAALRTRPGGAVSVFAPHRGTKAFSRGLEWPLDGVDLDMPWSGTLNRATAETFTVGADKPILVYLPDAPASRLHYAAAANLIS